MVEAEKVAGEAVCADEELLARSAPQFAIRGLPLLGEAALRLRNELGALLLDGAPKRWVLDQLVERDCRVALRVHCVDDAPLDVVEHRRLLGEVAAAVAVREQPVVQLVRRGDPALLDGAGNGLRPGGDACGESCALAVHRRR